MNKKKFKNNLYVLHMHMLVKGSGKIIIKGLKINL